MFVMRTLLPLFALLALFSLPACSSTPAVTTQNTQKTTTAPPTKAPHGPTHLEDVPFDAPYNSAVDISDAVEPLDDTEIFAVVYGDKILSKLTACHQQYPDQSSNFTVDFWARASNGSLSRLKVQSDKAGPDLERCIFEIFKSSVSFRPFGGSDKQATIPYKF